jgi:hypothetical protein
MGAAIASLTTAGATDFSSDLSTAISAASSSPMENVIITSPTLTTSPGFTRISRTFPEYGEGISTAALSVSTSIIISPSLTS